MPAYGNNLRPDEVTALVAFMSTLRPDYESGRTRFGRPRALVRTSDRGDAERSGEFSARPSPR